MSSFDLVKLTEIIRDAGSRTIARPNPDKATKEEMEVWEFLEALSDYVDARAQSLIDWNKDD